MVNAENIFTELQEHSFYIYLYKAQQGSLKKLYNLIY